MNIYGHILSCVLWDDKADQPVSLQRNVELITSCHHISSCVVWYDKADQPVSFQRRLELITSCHYISSCIL